MRRPVVTVAPAGSLRRYLAVVDSGSPLTVADPAFIRACGVDPDAEGVMTLPLQLGGHFAPVRVFELALELIAPAGNHTPIRWSALVAGRPQWRLPFAVLLGQRGWFDQFPTTIDDTFTTVHVKSE